MIKRALLLLSSCISLLAQDRVYTISYEASLSSTAAVLTLQLESSSDRRCTIVGLAVYSSVALDFTIEKGGGAATATAGTLVPINTKVTSSPTTEVYTASDGTAGTVMAKHSVIAGTTMSFSEASLKDMVLYSSGDRYHIRTASGTGTARIVVKVREQ